MADEKEQGTGGALEFGGAEQASKDAEAVEQEQGQEQVQEGQEEQADGTQVDQSQQPKEEGAETVDQDPKPAQQAEAPIEVEGKTFANKDELVNAYKNSSNEGRRLSVLEKELRTQLTEKDKRILELEDKMAEAPFPGLLSPDEAQEQAQLEMLPQAKQTEYILNKREWAKQQAAAKEQRAKAKAELDKHSESVKQVIEENEREMAAQTDKYPGFASLKPTREKVLSLTPFLANRPETPFVTYWIAYGLEQHAKLEAQGKAAAKGKEEAKLKAGSAQAQQAKGGEGRQQAAVKGGSTSPIVESYRNRTGGL